MPKKKQRRLYGSGNLRLRASKRHPESEWWIRWSVDGRSRTENSHFCECHVKGARRKAEKLLSRRLGETRADVLPSPQSKRVLVEDLAKEFSAKQRVDLLRKIPEDLPKPTAEWRKRRAEEIMKQTKARWENHLAPVFGHRKASLIQEQDLNEYIVARREAEARNTTINREMEMLRRMYRIGFERKPKLVTDLPHFPKLPEAKREGYIDDDQFEKLLAEIEAPGLKALILCAFRLGFRKAELQNILVRQLSDGWLRLYAGATKNGLPRIVKLPDDVHAVVKPLAKEKSPNDYLFTWPDGSQIRNFRAAWNKAAKQAGVPELVFHDLRRSAVRRGLRLGVPVSTLMKVSGHLTRATFDQYDVTGKSDLAEAAKIL